MSLEIFNRVLANIKDYDVKIIRLGENGDLFLNPNAIEMFRAIRKELPTARVELFNHFFILNRNLADTLLGEKLIDAVYMNIDGISTYRLAKNIKFERTSENLEYFIKKRNEIGLQIPVHIRALTFKYYMDAVMNNTGRSPVYLPKGTGDVVDDYAEIKSYVKSVIKPSLDSFKRTYACLWAERPSFEHDEVDRSKFHCPQMFKLETEVYVSPDGLWYLCCLDSRQQLVIGDLSREPLANLINSPKREFYLKSLQAREYEKVGGPCMTVQCCHIYHRIPLLSKLLMLASRYSNLFSKIYMYWRNLK
jgi:hypothetical protein